MDSRQNYLTQLHSYIEGIDKEVTLILQSLQWDRKHLLESSPTVTCKYNSNHKMPPDKVQLHERDCFLKSQGYLKEERMLSEPFDPNANTVVRFSTEDIKSIINNASAKNPALKRGEVVDECEPLTDDRLRCVYTADERRAIHEAAVCAVPACHDLSDLALPGSSEDGQKTKPKSRLEVLAELRDMKRRRAKYRVAAKTKNYSDVLRDVIRTQMEFYNEAQENIHIKTHNKDDTLKKDNNSKPHPNESNETSQKRRREDSRERNLETGSNRNREEEIPYKRHREDSSRRSDNRHSDYSRRNNSYDRRERFSGDDFRYRQKYNNDSRRDRDNDICRSREGSRNEEHSHRGDRYTSKNDRIRHDNTRYKHNDNNTSKADRRNREDYKETRVRTDRHYETIEIKKEIKEEIDSSKEDEVNEPNDADERSKYKHKTTKHKRHKKHTRRSKSKEKLIKVKEEYDSSPTRNSNERMFDDYDEKNNYDDDYSRSKKKHKKRHHD